MPFAYASPTIVTDNIRAPALSDDAHVKKVNERARTATGALITHVTRTQDVNRATAKKRERDMGSRDETIMT